MAQLSQDRLVRKESALGTIREIPPPQSHIGDLIAPWKDVPSDDVIFTYAIPDVDGLAPARAEDAESEMAQKDDSVGTGRAAIIDWAIKDHYDPSDVTRYREYLRIAEQLGGDSFRLTVGSMTEDFASKLARDQLRRKRKLDNRREWLIWQALETGSIAYNDGKIKFTVPFGRPGGQTNAAPTGALWSNTASDPINDILVMQQYMFDTYSVHMTKAIASDKVIRNIMNSTKFAARSGMTGATGGVPVDPRYLIDGWGKEAALAVVERATGVKMLPYDAVYRTRPLGSLTTTNNRFFSDTKILFLPSDADIEEMDDGMIGFAKTLTSPHPEGNWSSGYYEWEKDTGPDPWGIDRGTGVKMFPVFPHMELSYTMTVL